MKLEKRHLDLLRSVRHMMREDAKNEGASNPYVSSYICANLDLYVMRITERLDYEYEERCKARDELKEAICRGIGGCVSFGGWLRISADNDFKWSRTQASKFYVLGRLAWLDKIIATEEILPSEWHLTDGAVLK